MTLREESLPNGWRIANLGELAAITGGLTRNASKRDSSQNRAPLVSVAAVQLRHIDVKAVAEVGLLESDGDRATLRAGDLLVVEGNGSLEHIGRVALWNDEVPGARHQNHIIRVRPHDLSSRYVLEWLASPSGREAIVQEATSAAGLYTLSLSKVERIPVPVPPPGEEERIVAKLDALQSRSRRAREALDAIPPLLERFRQSVLAAAFRGDLTAEWRTKNPKVEPASELLKRIRAERRRRWEESELAKMKSKGKPPTDDRWKAKYEAPQQVDLKGVFELPNGWEWCSIEELCPFDAPAVYGIIQPGDDVPNGVPYLRPLDVLPDGSIDFTSVKRTSPEIALQYSRASLRTGDIVLSIVGTIGKVIITPPELDQGNITQSSARLRPPEWMPSDYLRLALLSPVLTKQYDKYRFGNAVQRLNVEHVRRLAIPIAPQAEIAQVLATTTRELGRIPTQALADSTSLLAQLDAAILAKAFRGELVPHDPNDEPASALLAAERAATASAASPPPARRSKRGSAKPRA